MSSLGRGPSHQAPFDPSQPRRRIVAGLLPAESRVLLAGLVILAGLGLAISGNGVRTGSHLIVAAPDLVLEPNSAPLRALTVLPHVGAGLANRLSEARAERPFSCLLDLRTRVRGMGAVTLARIAPYLRFPATPQSGFGSL